MWTGPKFLKTGRWIKFQTFFPSSESRKLKCSRVRLSFSIQLNCFSVIGMVTVSSLPWDLHVQIKFATACLVFEMSSSLIFPTISLILNFEECSSKTLCFAQGERLTVISHQNACLINAIHIHVYSEIPVVTTHVHENIQESGSHSHLKTYENCTCFSNTFMILENLFC